MRLALIIYGSLATVSGGYLYDRKLVEHLRAQGDEVEIIALPWRSYSRHLADNLAPGLRRRLLSARFDLILQDELNHPSLFHLNHRLRPTLSAPIVSIVHHLRSSERHPRPALALYRRVERHYLRSVDAFIFNSAATRAETVKLAGADRPFEIAPPAGDRFRPTLSPGQIIARAHEPGPLRLLFLGNLIPRKGLHTLLAALAQTPPSCCTLTIIGDPAVDPAYSAAIRRQIERSGLSKRVELGGPLPDTALGEVLARSQVLAVPSRYEGFGIVYLEGMGFGLPAIAGTAGGVVEIVNHAENGYLAPPGEAGVLAAHLRRLSADRALLERMSLAARARFQAHPTWAQTAARIRRFLTTLASA